MKKDELLADLASKKNVAKLVGVAELVGNEQEIKIYHQSYLEVFNNVAKVKKTAIYVIDEGKLTEVAYYVAETIPKSSVEDISKTISPEK
jgi:hypothetical protein